MLAIVSVLFSGRYGAAVRISGNVQWGEVLQNVTCLIAIRVWVAILTPLGSKPVGDKIIPSTIL